jgi:hypothetical protein
MSKTLRKSGACERLSSKHGVVREEESCLVVVKCLLPGERVAEAGGDPTLLPYVSALNSPSLR